ncbi:CHAT domain-containing protein [Nostoc spongiaeforme FACHB-130]|uniref:CHAT domain-containing protein n=1 Tax=Nostoc spongiaeforme FACHB-130 TaxID=1357510 RepID=A0ABR8G1V9_9NOSO|nr:CHAT domain-containing protein [Nostoc spongiaeforme]MBD2597162.1 CHAT domain-containing protein [Nostoc spongiaeforme FACHB-130]
MSKRRLNLLALSTFSLFVIGLDLLKFSQAEIKAVPPIEKQIKLPVSRLRPDIIKRLLDREDINSAVIHIERGWKQQYDEYMQVKLPSNQVIEVNKISQTLKNINQRVGKKSALIYAVPTADQLDLILVLPDKPPIHKRIPEAKKEVLTNLVTKFRNDVTNPSSSRKRYLASGKKIYDFLVAPLASELKSQGINNLLFCLGGGLRTVPLAAISDGKTFLIEKYSLTIIPAFSLLDLQLTNITKTQVLAMGASKFQSLEPLPAVPLELSNIVNNNWKGKSLLNQDFTLKNLKKERAKYPFGIVHFATHAEFAQGSVDKSYIQFWDRKIRLDELKSLGLNNPPVELLVLSACRTALGDPQAELGFAGLAVQSGAKAALASLWEVSDGGTLALMLQFYDKLKANPVKSEAIRKAQIDMLKERVSLEDNPRIRGAASSELHELDELDEDELSHPYYWAGFTLIGNPW